MFTTRRIAILVAIVGLALAARCANIDTLDPPGQDKDKDGFSVSAGDCDDTDALVHPEAAERVNCVDDNCDGAVDEGTTNHDKDNDGFCPSLGDVGSCEGDSKRYPGQSEDGGDGSKKPNGIDDDCDGLVDEGLPSSDIDKDGFTLGDNDCNDQDPYVNPGAIEVPALACTTDKDCPTAASACLGGYCRCAQTADCSTGTACKDDTGCKTAGERCLNKKCTSTLSCMAPQKGLTETDRKVCRDNVDNDCDKKIDELPVLCDDPAALSQSDAHDYARAIELCDVDLTCGVDRGCPGKLKCVDGRCRRVLTATFNSSGDSRARAIATRFAKNGPFTPQKGQSFVVLASGLATYDPAQVCPQQGTSFTNTAPDPDPKATDPTANDYVELALEILVPTNARSFSFDFHFFSTEYPEYIGTQFNDTFWVQLQSLKHTGNISYDKNGVPIRINNAFFSICDPWSEKPSTLKMCTKPASILTGTGYNKECNMYGGGIPNGGSTDWLHTTAPVTPGEKIRLTFSIFDKGDRILDSAVLIDNFRWKLAPASKPSTEPVK